MKDSILLQISLYVWGKSIPQECTAFAQFIDQMITDLKLEITELNV